MILRDAAMNFFESFDEVSRLGRMCWLGQCLSAALHPMKGLADLGLSTRLPMKARQMACASRSHMCFLTHIWLIYRACLLA
jgi:hypothetical protein